MPLASESYFNQWRLQITVCHYDLQCVYYSAILYCLYCKDCTEFWIHIGNAIFDIVAALLRSAAFHLLWWETFYWKINYLCLLDISSEANSAHTTCFIILSFLLFNQNSTGNNNNVSNDTRAVELFNVDFRQRRQISGLI